jgi:hypothetical protein
MKDLVDTRLSRAYSTDLYERKLFSCVLRHRVTVLTLCPLGEPEIAIGHEPPIVRTMVATKSNRLPSFKNRRRLHHSK